MTHNAVDIVLVEDSPTDRELTLRTLAKHKLANHIQVFEDGAAALDFFRGRGKFESQGPIPVPKLVLLDLKLPKTDGLEVLRFLRKNEPTRRVPVVVLTSSQEERDLVEAYSLGVNSYIVKPVDFESFTEAVREIGFYWLLLNEPPR